jgi:hypothetical protein
MLPQLLRHSYAGSRSATLGFRFGCLRDEKVQYEAKIDHLRHSKFAGLREDNDARTVIKEHGGEG